MHVFTRLKRKKYKKLYGMMSQNYQFQVPLSSMPQTPYGATAEPPFGATAKTPQEPRKKLWYYEVKSGE
jgi:hypothetical protein